MKKTFIILGIAVASIACKKNASQTWESNDAIYFTQSTDQLGDSITYSFALQPQLQDRDTLYLNMAIMGLSQNVNRSVRLVAAEGTTAIEGVHYIIPEGNLPADQFSLEYPIILINTSDLVQQTYTLNLKLADNSAFNTIQYSTNNTFQYPQIKIRFNNQLLQPWYWNNLYSFFGAYSDTKYRFMIETIGISNFNVENFGGPNSYSDALNMIPVLQTALSNYELINGPLLDENGVRITF